MNDSRMLKSDRTRKAGGERGGLGEGVRRQTVVVVDLRRIVFWGLREDGGGGTQGGGGFAVGGKLWLAERPPFSNMSR